MQCIHRTSNTLTMAVRALGLVLLFSFVVALSGLPTTPPDLTAENTHEEHTLSTELQPPPLDDKEHHATIYIINLYAVKNNSDNTEEVFENEVIETVPDILEPLATVLLVVEDDDDESEKVDKRSASNFDEFADELEVKGIKVDRINLNNNAKLIRVKLHKTEAQSMVDAAAKPSDVKKDRKKRTICLKCGGGGGGGYPSGGGGHGGGYCPRCNSYPSGGGYQTAVIPVVVIPITGGGGGGIHKHRGGGGGGYYPPSGGGYYPPSGGCNTCGGGGGGGGGSYSQSSASASAQSSSGSWGGK